MNFVAFKNTFLKETVQEYPNETHLKQPMITIKLVTYNHVGFIKQCLDSVLSQKTTFDFQVLIAEDDSTDGTREICVDYAQKHPNKIRLLLNSRKNNIPVNGKPSGFFNSTYANYCITSKYVSILEGDDYLTDDYSLQKRFDFLESHEDYVMCFHGIRYYSQYNEKFTGQEYKPFDKSTTVESNHIVLTPMPTSSILFRHGLVELYTEGMKEIECGDVVLRGKLCQYGKARYLDTVTPSVYRLHQGGVHSSRTVDNRYNEIIKAREYLLQYYKTKKWNSKPIHYSLTRNYLSQFINTAKTNKVIKLSLLKRSYSHSRYTDETFISLFSSKVINPIFKKAIRKISIV